jgi:hypothetical protein
VTLILLPLLALPLTLPLVKTLATRPEDGPAMNAATAGTAPGPGLLRAPRGRARRLIQSRLR